MNSAPYKIFGTYLFILLLTAFIGPVAITKAAPGPQPAIQNSQSNESIATPVASQTPPLERKVSIWPAVLGSKNDSIACGMGRSKPCYRRLGACPAAGAKRAKSSSGNKTILPGTPTA